MKERLNLTIDREVLEAMKVYAASKQMSVSELVESYFRAVIRPAGRKSLLDLVDALERPGEVLAEAVGTGEGAPGRIGKEVDHGL